jgi:mannosyl-glycoprotein endo-beta-N-acetylglucosaminidase
MDGQNVPEDVQDVRMAGSGQPDGDCIEADPEETAKEASFSPQRTESPGEGPGRPQERQQEHGAKEAVETTGTEDTKGAGRTRETESQLDLRFCGELLPLTTLKSLLEWEPKQEYVSRALYVPQERLSNRQRVAEEGEQEATKIICCHDMMGGYLEDRHVMGSDRPSYTFRHWRCIDGFVYFSHWFVTIPPPCWVNAGHRHGCPVYGTIITEWDAGRELLEELLSSPAKMERSVQQLVNIALYYRFDGWLVNVENEIDVEHIANLLEFVRMLTDAMHRAVSHAKVLWYDAVTVNGTLEWQNALTPLNRPFFDRCDGIWINYTWKEGDPNRIRDAAGERWRDVYLGVDCFGRGTYGGGGLNTYVGVEAAKNAALNVGLFAPAWPYQHYKDGDEDRLDVQANNALKEMYRSWYEFDEEFWYRIDRVNNRRRPVITMLPFSTDFSVGQGSAYYSNGALVGPGRSWYNVNLQSLQSTPWLHDSHHSNIYTCSITRGTAFNRANCFLVEGGVGEPMRVRLYQTLIPLGGMPGIPGIGLKCTAAVSKGINLRIALKISRRGSKESIIVELDTATANEFTSNAIGSGGSSGLNGSQESSFVSTYLVKPPSKQLKVGKVVLNSSEDHVKDVKPLEGSPWVTSDFGVLAVDLPAWVWVDGWITSIDAVVRPITSGSMCKCNVALGNLSAWFLTREFPPCQPVSTIFPEFVDLVPVRDDRGGIKSTHLSLMLVWEAPRNVRRFQVWYQCKTTAGWDTVTFLAAVTVPLYNVQLPLEVDVVAVRFEARSEVGPSAQNSRTAMKRVIIDFSPISESASH